jgi:23S rRNA (adenine2503-C2)-methyltransferase
VELVRGLPGVEAEALKRVTISGVGEPLHNHHHVASFVSWCREQRIGPSLTTSGGPLNRLRQWLHLPHNGLTISVHAGSEDTRARLVPKGPSLAALSEALRSELPSLSQSRKRKVALAYLLLDAQNDTEAELGRFVGWARPLALPIHLYAHNPVASSPLRGVSRARYEQAYEQLSAAGLRVRMSSKARQEQTGGCGTLVALHARRHPERSTRKMP